MNRAKTISKRDIARELKRESKTKTRSAKTVAAMPKTRGDCGSVQRPCPFIRCRHHLFLEEKEGAVKFRFGEDPSVLSHMHATCSLDVASQGDASLESVGRLLNLTRERVRQLEEGAIEKLSSYMEQNDLNPKHMSLIEELYVEEQSDQVLKALNLGADATWLKKVCRQWEAESEATL